MGNSGLTTLAKEVGKLQLNAKKMAIPISLQDISTVSFCPKSVVVKPDLTGFFSTVDTDDQA